MPLTGASDPIVVHDVPDSGGLQLHVVERLISAEDLEEHIPPGTRSVSVFLVNHRAPVAGDKGPTSLTPSSPRSRCEATGHSCRGRTCAARGPRSGTSRWPTSTTPTRPSTRRATASRPNGRSSTARAVCSAPRGSRVPRWRRRRPWTVPGVELSMEALGALADGAAAEAALRPLVVQYRAGSRTQRTGLATLQGTRARRRRSSCASPASPPTGSSAASRSLAGDADALDAFRVANRAVARALRQRLKIETPRWRAFQLAFILLNLPGLADPRDPHRETVDLLFFPTGGGKTEAYLGLAAFAMVLRRLRHPGENGPRRRRRERDHALHAAAPHARPARARRRACVRAWSSSARRTKASATASGPSRSACGWARPRRPTSSGARATGARTRRAAKVRQFKADPKRQALADPARELPVVRDALRARLVRAAARTTTSRASCASSARTSSATSRATARSRSWPWTSRSTGGSRPS